MPSTFTLTADHERWARRAHQKYKKGKQFFLDLIIKQDGKCALTNTPLFFDSKNGTSKKGGPGVHPLYATIDHVHPGKNDNLQILCYDINDLKAHLPPPLFEPLTKTEAWKIFVEAWRKTALHSVMDRKLFKDLINRGTPVC